VTGPLANKPLKLSVPPQGDRSIIVGPASAAGPQLNGKPFGRLLRPPPANGGQPAHKIVTMIDCNRWQPSGIRGGRAVPLLLPGNTGTAPSVEMRTSHLGSALCVATFCLSPACDSNNCEGHQNGEEWCKDSWIMQCQEGSPIHDRYCAPNSCFEGSCVLAGVTCPTATLGYQCLGEHKVWCLANGMVEDEGVCAPSRDGSMYSVEGPYCVENPGGSVLDCGWKKERCTTEDEVRCFDDGSAQCIRNVYQAFMPNDKAGQATCAPTPLSNCWAGKTWCEGDVLKRCDRCLDEQTCGSVTIESTCSPGACAPYPRPSWMVEPSVDDDTLYGCATYTPACVGTTAMACAGDAPATCVADHLAVVGLSCAAVQTSLGTVSNVFRAKYGPYCVTRTAQGDAICAHDPQPCTVEGARRCAPDDSNGVLMDTCQGSVWLYRETCANSSNETTICQSTASGAFCK
jgi:hypothetical protein